MCVFYLLVCVWCLCQITHFFLKRLWKIYEMLNHCVCVWAHPDLCVCVCLWVCVLQSTSVHVNLYLSLFAFYLKPQLTHYTHTLSLSLTTLSGEKMFILSNVSLWNKQNKCMILLTSIVITDIYKYIFFLNFQNVHFNLIPWEINFLFSFFSFFGNLTIFWKQLLPHLITTLLTIKTNI